LEQVGSFKNQIERAAIPHPDGQKPVRVLRLSDSSAIATFLAPN
jgi:hypothetical protein